VYLKIFKFLKLLCLLSISLTLNAQNRSVTDSLEAVLNTKSGIDRFEILYALSFEHVPDNTSRALECADELIALAASSSDSVMIVKSLLSKGYILRTTENFNDALVYFQRALNIAKRNNFHKEAAYILNSLALIYTANDNYDKALEYNYQSLIIREAHGTAHDVAVTLNNLGWLYSKLGSTEEALQFYQRSLKLKTENDITYDLDRLLLNIGGCYNKLRDYEASQKYVREGLRVCGEDCLPEKLIDGYLALGISFKEINIDSAKFYFDKSLTTAKQSNLKNYQIQNYTQLSELELLRKDDERAKMFLDSAEQMARETGYNGMLKTIYEDYARLYMQVGDFEKASKFQQRYIELNDSLVSSRLRNIVNIETSYRERENIQTIADKENIIRRQQSLTIAIVVIAILVASLTFVLYRSNAVKKRVNAELSEAKAIIEDQNRQLLNSNIHLDKELKERNVDLEKANESLRKVNEELDNFIYKTSHDIRGPLASLRGMCNVAMLDVKDALALDYLKKLDVTAEKLNTILTRLLIVNQINNSAIAMAHIDFSQIIAEVIALEKKKGVPNGFMIRRNVQSGIEYYSDKEFIQIIFENLIDNAIKFRRRSAHIESFVLVEVATENDQLLIRVTDNGIGVNQTQPDKIFQMFSRGSDRSETGGIGLYITKTAVQKLGGVIDLKTTVEGYTEFSVILPFVNSPVPA
jgi:signal transduction histidine kinase